MFQKNKKYIINCKNCGKTWITTQKEITEYKCLFNAIVSEKMSVSHNSLPEDLSLSQQSLLLDIQRECKDPRVCLNCGTKNSRKKAISPQKL